MLQKQASRASYQMPGDADQDRSDHIWYQKSTSPVLFKCVLCGAVTIYPPDYPTPKAWTPRGYEDLTPDERNLVPFQ